MNGRGQGKKRKRVEKGILGVPKKKSVLFTFAPRKGEECSSDSEDTDYVPGRNSESEEEQEKRIKRKSSVGQGVKKRDRKLRSEAQPVSSDLWLSLPPEILLKIFKYGIEWEGFLKFLSRVAQVCKQWNQLSKDPSLFHELDLTLIHGEITRKKLDHILQYDLSQCVNVNLNCQFKLNSASIESILSVTSRVVSLDLYNCSGISAELVRRIPSMCPELQRLDLSFSSQISRKVPMPVLADLVKGLGAQLVELRLARTMALTSIRSSLNDVFELLSLHCPNLEELDLRVNTTSEPSSAPQKCVVDMTVLTKGCPKLKELRLDGFNLLDGRANKLPITGLGNLKIYSQTCQKYESSETPVFYNLFGSVQSLTELDISYTNLQPHHIAKNVKEVKMLNLSSMRWKGSEHNNLMLAVGAWQNSVEVLNLAFNKLRGHALDAALCQYTQQLDGNATPYPLKELILANSSVHPSTVHQVIKACKNLQLIDLTSCRELPRGAKRAFNKKELQALLKILDSHVNTTDEDDGGVEEEEDTDGTDWDSDDDF